MRPLPVVPLRLGGALAAAALALPLTLAPAVLAVGAVRAAEPADGDQLLLPADVPDVDGSDPGAPSSLPAGWSRTDLPVDGSRYLTYERAIEGSTVSVVAAGPGAGPTSAEAFRLELTTPGGTTCESEFASRPEGSPGLVAVTAATESVEPEAEGVSSSEEECRDAGSLRVTLGRSSSTEAADDSTIWFRVVEEAPLASTDDLEPAAERAGPEPVDVGGEARDRAGARDVAAAPLVDTGIWRGSVSAGGAVAYRVRLDWGQTVHAEAVTPALDDDTAADAGPARLTVTVLSPLLSSGTSSSTSDGLGSDPASARAAAGPVRYANRFEVSPGPSVPGEHVVVVGLEDVDPGSDLDAVDFSLRLRVDGEPDPAPDFAPGGPYVTADGPADLVPVGLSVPAEEDGSSWARTAAGGGLVAGGLVALAGGLVLLRRSRA